MKVPIATIAASVDMPFAIHKSQSLENKQLNNDDQPETKKRKCNGRCASCQSKRAATQV